MTSMHDQTPPDDERTLSAEDQAALDALVEHEWDATRIADPELRQRAMEFATRSLAPLAALREREASLRAMQPDEDLVDATLVRIGVEEEQRRERYSIAAGAGLRSRSRGIRIPDFITVAALILLSIAVLFPMAANARHGAELASCAASLGDLFQGFGCYADDHNGYTPTAEGFGGLFERLNKDGLNPSTDRIEESASGCLHALESGGYCTGTCTQCCGVRPISVRIPMHRRHLILAFQKDTPLAGDANPFICQLRACERMATMPCGAGGGTCCPPPAEPTRNDLNSPNHGGRGQNILGGDGSIRWIVTPVLMGQGPSPSDNIWLPRCMDGIERFQFSELREDPFEIVLAH